MSKFINHWKICLLVLIAYAVCFVMQNSAYAIKIGLITKGTNAVIATSKPGYIINPSTGRKIAELSSMEICQISKYGSILSIKINGHAFSLGTNYIEIVTAPGGFIFTKRSWYRGKLAIYNLGDNIIVVNDLDLESYLQGVVPSEMPSSWNVEAHKAQAVAARSYAIANMGKRAHSGYDLKDTPEDQAYGGASRETAKTNYAVAQTKGQVLVCGNKVIPAYYSSSAGGHTLNAGSVWLKNLPFVRSVPSFDEDVPKNGHGVGMSQHGANVMANYGYNAYQILGYFYQNVKLYRVNASL